MTIASSEAPTEVMTLFMKRLRNSSRTVEVCEDRVGRQAERAPALPVRLEVDPGDEVALRARRPPILNEVVIVQ